MFFLFLLFSVHIPKKKIMSTIVLIAKIVAIICLLCMFVVSGVNKLFHFESTVKNLASKAPWWPEPRISIVLTIILEIICPLLILYSQVASDLYMNIVNIVVLLVFTITVTLIYHPLNLKAKYMKNIPFFSNLSLIGGLSLLLLV